MYLGSPVQGDRGRTLKRCLGTWEETEKMTRTDVVQLPRQIGNSN